jgi:HlyD family secretion protein
VRIVIEHQEDVLKVPLAALRFQPQGTKLAQDPEPSGLWVRTARGALRRVPVSVGAAGAEQVALKDGDVVEGSEVAVGQAIRPAGMKLLGLRFGS